MVYADVLPLFSALRGARTSGACLRGSVRACNSIQTTPSLLPQPNF